MSTMPKPLPPWQSSMRVVALTAAALLSPACGTSDGLLGGVQDVVADVVLPPQQAAQLGARMAAEIESKQPLADAAAQRRVAAVGRRLLAQVEDVPAAYDFTFKVIQAPDTVNAFALPGGYIYVTTGMMQLVDNEAQLAAVVAHEIAHVTQRHVAERMATSYGVQFLGAAALGQDPGMVAQLATSLLQQGFLLKYSREQETQADLVGLRYLAAAGYDPHAAVEVFRQLAETGGARPPVFLSSHPPPADRIERLQEAIRQGGLSAAPPAGAGRGTRLARSRPLGPITWVGPITFTRSAS